MTLPPCSLHPSLFLLFLYISPFSPSTLNFSPPPSLLTPLSSLPPLCPLSSSFRLFIVTFPLSFYSSCTLTLPTHLIFSVYLFPFMFFFQSPLSLEFLTTQSEESPQSILRFPTSINGLWSAVRVPVTRVLSPGPGGVTTDCEK